MFYPTNGKMLCQMCEKRTIEIQLSEISVSSNYQFIIDNNATREKTAEQKSREAKALKEVESVLAEKRYLITQNNNKAKQLSGTPKLAGLVKGEARDIVAKKVGFKSGHEVDRGIKRKSPPKWTET